MVPPGPVAWGASPGRTGPEGLEFCSGVVTWPISHAVRGADVIKYQDKVDNIHILLLEIHNHVIQMVLDHILVHIHMVHNIHKGIHKDIHNLDNQWYHHIIVDLDILQ